MPRQSNWEPLQSGRNRWNGFQITWENYEPRSALLWTTHTNNKQPDQKQGWEPVEDLRPTWTQTDFLHWKDEFNVQSRRLERRAIRTDWTFGEFWPVALKERAQGIGGKKLFSITEYERRLRHPYLDSLQSKRIWDTEPEDILQCIRVMEQAFTDRPGGLNPKTRERYMVPVQMVFTHAIFRDIYAKGNPVARLRLDNTGEERKHWIYDQREISKLFALLNELPEEEYSYNAFVRIAYAVGGRQCEIHGLRVEDLLLDEGSLWIRGQIDPKTLEWKAGRKGSHKNGRGLIESEIPVEPGTIAVIKRQLQRVARMNAAGEWQGDNVIRALQRGDLLFPDLTPAMTGHFIQKARVQLGRPFVDEPGYDKLSLHELRHNFGSLMITHGRATREEVAYWMGDTVATVEKHYRHELRPHMRDRNRQADRIMGSWLAGVEAAR